MFYLPSVLASSLTHLFLLECMYFHSRRRAIIPIKQDLCIIVFMFIQSYNFFFFTEGYECVFCISSKTHGLSCFVLV